MKPKNNKSRKLRNNSIIQSIIKRGKIYCINHKKNKTNYWGDDLCNEYTTCGDNTVRWVCSSCVAKLVPMPASFNKPKINNTSTEPRRRGRPIGRKAVTVAITPA